MVTRTYSVTLEGELPPRNCNLFYDHVEFYDLIGTEFIEGRKPLWFKNYFIRDVLYLFFSWLISQNDVGVTFPRGRLMWNHAWQRTLLSRFCGGSCRGKVLGKWKMSKHYSNSVEKQGGEWNFYHTIAFKTTNAKNRRCRKRFETRWSQNYNKRHFSDMLRRWNE